MEERKQLSEETRRKIRAQIASLKAQMRYDANDLEFETHLHMMRELENVLKRA